MPSGNKIVGRVYAQFLNINIYISSKLATHGLCGSYDRNRSNDLMNKLDGSPATLDVNRIIDVGTAASWRSVCE